MAALPNWSEGAKVEPGVDPRCSVDYSCANSPLESCMAWIWPRSTISLLYTVHRRNDFWCIGSVRLLLDALLPARFRFAACVNRWLDVVPARLGSG